MKALTTDASDRESAVSFILGEEEHVLLASRLTDNEWLDVIRGMIKEVKPQLKHLKCFKLISELTNCGFSIGDIREITIIPEIYSGALAPRYIGICSRITEESEEKVILEKYYRDPPMRFSRDTFLLSEKGQIIHWKASYECACLGIEELGDAKSNFDVVYRAKQPVFSVLDDENLLKSIKLERSVIARSLAQKLYQIFSEKCKSMEDHLSHLQKRKSFLDNIVNKKIGWDERFSS